MPKNKPELIIEAVKSCAKSVYSELGPGWSEAVYQKAMEVSLRLAGFKYESLKVLPLAYAGYNIGECELDFLIWTDDKPPLGIVVDLKVDTAVKESHDYQVKRYIQELRKAEEGKREVHNQGLVIAFGKASTKQIESEEEEGVLFAIVDESEPPAPKGKKDEE
jgi:GxxExxY protein